jgi:hypothetical protein
MSETNTPDQSVIKSKLKFNIKKKKEEPKVKVTKAQYCWEYLLCHFREYLEKVKNASAIKIQALFRGCHLRKKLATLNDNYTYEILNRCLDKYISDLKFNNEINLIMSEKKRRNENFPSDISENIAKLVIFAKYSIMPCWDTAKGDIIIDKKDIFKQIEVKGFMSTGPSSFGPTEKWDWIYFVDGIDIRNKNFKVYEIRLSNESEIWKNIRISGQDFSDEDIPNLPDNMSVLTNHKLKELCGKRGLVKGGNKKELIDRLQTQEPGSKFKKPKTYGEICNEKRRGELRSSFYATFKPQLGEYCKLIFDGHISELDNTN